MDEAEKRHWRGLRRGRPERVVAPGPGQESVWAYPRPPRLERAVRHARVEHVGEIVAESARAWRVCETASPPVYYLPPEDVRMEWLSVSTERSFCEWKGAARYWDLAVGERRVKNAAWSYPEPDGAFAALRDHLAFYPGRVDGCFLDDERVRPQAGGFYGGWISDEIVGPFKGDPGTEGW